MKNRSYKLLVPQLNVVFNKGSHFSHHQTMIFSIKRTFCQWHLVGAVCLERKPVITQPLNSLEERYWKHLQKLEVQNSFLSNHEKRQLTEKKVLAKLEAGQMDEVDTISKQTAQDFEDACVEELNKYKPASRITEADEKNDRTTFQRKLDSSLLLVLNHKLGNDFKWILPQAVHVEGETLRQTAERALNEVCIHQGNVLFMGNAPVGYYKYKYPKVVRGDGICGAKVFFFKAQILNPSKTVQVQHNELISGHAWLSHQELDELLQPMYCKVVQSFLFPDTFDVDATEGLQTSSDEAHTDKHIASSAG